MGLFYLFFYNSSLKSTIIKEDEIESRQERINQKLFTDPELNRNPLKAVGLECGFCCFCKNIENNKRNLILHNMIINLLKIFSTINTYHVPGTMH